MKETFISNKYLVIYLAIITKARSDTTRKKGEAGRYFERHHILPAAMGGDNSAENLILLTAREHFICHWLLPKFVSEAFRRKMLSALGAMAAYKRLRKLTSRQYEVTRRAKRDAQLGIQLNLTPEQRLRLGDATRGKPRNPEAVKKTADWLRGTPKDDIHRKRCSDSAKKSPLAERHRKVLHTDPDIRRRKSETMRATAATPEGKAQRIALIAKRVESGYPRDHVCEHCGRAFTKSRYVRWHGPNCKERMQHSLLPECGAPTWNRTMVKPL